VVYDPAFALGSMDWIGFDIDCTLVRYRMPALTALVYGLLADYLVDRKGYPPELREGPSLEAQKGIVFEHATGNHLKLDAEGRVAVAWHGCHRRLSDAELAETYGDGEWWGCAALRKQQRHEGFTVWLSYFDLPGVPLTARLVDLCDRSAAPAAAAAAYPFVPDVLAAFNAAFDFTHFAAGTGGYFSALQADPDRYLEPRPGLQRWLEALRHAGRRLFVCTNSHLDYSDFTMTHALGPDWRDLFDVVVVFALKPGFFHSIQPYRTVAIVGGQVVEGAPLTELFAGCDVACGGNAAALQALANACKVGGGPAVRVPLDGGGHVTSDAPQSLRFDTDGGAGPDAEAHNRARVHTVSMGTVDGLDVEGGEHVVGPRGSPLAPGLARIAYIGDHLHGDVAATGQLAGWSAVCVAEELEAAAPLSLGTPVQWPLKDGPAASPSVGHTAAGEAAWGSFFDTHSGAPSWYGRLIADRAALAVPDLACLIP